MSTERTRSPDKKLPNPRDHEGHLTDQVRSAWRKATHAKVEVEVQNEEGEGDDQKKKSTRYRWRRREGTASLKDFARKQGGDAGARWLHNKAANTSRPQLGIGSTRKKKGSGGGGSPAAKPGIDSDKKR